MWVPADVVLVSRFPSNGRFSNEIVGCVVSRFVLQGDATCEFETRAQLFEGRLNLNPGLNLTLLSFSCVQKYFFRIISLLFLELPIINS